MSSEGILESVGLDALCYVVLLLMPVLGRMSDQQEDVRHMASRCFATLVTLMPLEVDGLYLACKTLYSSSEAHFLRFTLCSRVPHPNFASPVRSGESSRDAFLPGRAEGEAETVPGAAPGHQ